MPPTKKQIDNLEQTAIKALDSFEALPWKRASRAVKRLYVLFACLDFQVTTGASRNAAARHLGITSATLCRHFALFRKGGLIALAGRPMGGPKGHRKHSRKQEGQD